MTDYRPDKEYLVIYTTEGGVGNVFQSRKTFTAKSSHLLLAQLAKDEVDRTDHTLSIHIELIGEKKA